jgi:CDP-glucose 4,6-dehydratase
MNFRACYAGKKVFLTGHTGFKGAWLSEWLLGLGANLTGFSLDIPTQPSLFETLELSRRMQDLRGDIRELGSLSKAMSEAKPEIVFHLAAQALVRESYDDPIGTFATNIMGTANVLEAARFADSVKAVVVVTTDKVYENADQGLPFRESDPLGGHDPYSASKAGAEIVFSSYTRSFLRGSFLHAASARAGNVIGGGDWAVDRLVPDCIRAWAKGDGLMLRNPGSVRPWQHVLEPLAGYLAIGQRLLEKPERVTGEAFNFGPAGEATRSALQLVEEMEKHWPGATHEVRALEDGKKEAALLSLDPAKARRELGWEPKLNFAATAAWTAEWYRAGSNPAECLRLTREQIRRYENL